MSASTPFNVSVAPKKSGEEPWTCRSHVSVFLRCLHLLDLDLLDDWPGITEKTFTTKTSQQNIQHRIRAMEWSLFKLFELYSPREAQNKLNPFFPPLTSLQSLNLRAALMRCLTELKRNGALGRDLVIRKTMLDECKGDRLEELLSSFALLVLRSSRKRYDEAKSLSAAAACDTEAQHRIPLILAHRHSLQGTLASRQKLQRRAEVQSETMERESSQLNDRKSRALQPPDGASTPEVRAAVDTFSSSFTAESHWMDVVTHKGSSKSITSASVNADRPLETVEPTGQDLALAKLDSCLQRHRDEVSRWQDFRRSLPISEPAKEPSDMPKLKSHPLLLFDKHQVLKPSVKAESATISASQELEILPPYRQLLQHLDGDFRSTRSPSADAESQVATRSLKSQDDVVSCAEEESAHRMNYSGSLPMRACLSQSSSDQNFLSAPELLNSDVSKPVVEPDESNFSWLDESPTGQTLADGSNIKADSNVDDTKIQPKDHGSPFRGVSESGIQTRFKIVPAAEHKRRGSSIGTNGPPESPEEPAALPVCRPPPATLLERTRQSMTLAAAAAGQKPSRKKSTRSRVSQYPVSQFETPERATYREPPLSATSNDSTPREKIFSDDADYMSVFKTRPKVALSPVISPVRSLIADSILEHQMGTLDMKDDEE